MLRASLLTLALLSILMPAAASAQDPAPESPPDVTQTQLMDAPTKYTLRASRGPEPPTDRDLTLLNFAYLEQGGHLPRGFTDMVADEGDAQQPKAEAPPQRLFRDIHLVCDLDGDGIQDLVANQIHRQTLATAVYAYSGADGSVIWFRPGQLYLQANHARNPHFNVYSEPGWPQPHVPENFEPTLDINDDGVCDFILYGVTFSTLGIDPQVRQYTFAFYAVNGSYAYFPGGTINCCYSEPGFWSHVERAVYTFTYDPSGLIGNPQCWQATMLNFVTGFEHGFTPVGARFVIKTTDTLLAWCSNLGMCPVYDWRTNEHIKYFDSDTKTLLWQRDLNQTREDDATQKSADPTGKSKEKVNNITYITGLANLQGNDELEVVLHQFWFSTPRTCNVNDPVSGTPIFNVGTGMNTLALRGERGSAGGTDLWRVGIFDTGSYRINFQNEESFETLVWVFGQILPDMTGDGIPEVFPSYLMQERNSPTSQNGAYRTHIQPLDGATGKRLLPGVDLKAQGWGYSAWMGVDPAKAVPYFAVGTADVPTAVPPAGRFPPKDVRLTVIDISDGAPLWSWREQFSQDGFLQFDLTLNQYLNALAPNDYDGDGLRELLTPAQYVSPAGANQTLLAQAEHFYQTLNGMTGEPLHTIRAFGPSGVALTCKESDTGLMVFSGHSRRIDGTRFELGFGSDNVTQAFRHPLYNNPDFAAATQGTDIVSWGNKCVMGPDARVSFSTNPELFSNKRGLEIKNVYGAVQSDGELSWQVPPVEGKPPLSIDEILRYFEVETPSRALTLALTAGPIAPGIVAGIGLGRLRARKGGL